MSREINLLQPAFYRKRRSPLSAAVLGPALVLALAGGIAWYLVERAEGALLAAQLAAVEQGVKDEQARHERLVKEAAARRKDAALEAEVARLEGQLVARRSNLEALKSGAIGDPTGYSGHMRGLARQSLAGLWITGFAIAGNEVSISGRTLSADLVPSYLKRLGTEPAFSGRSFSMLTIRHPAPAGRDVAAPAAWLEFSLASAPADTPGAGQGGEVRP